MFSCSVFSWAPSSRLGPLLPEANRLAAGKHTHTHKQTHTWWALGPGASTHVDHSLIRRLGVVRPECGHTDALRQLDLAVAVLDHLHLPGPLEQEHPVHAHPGRLAHLIHPAGGQLVQRLRALCGCLSACSHLQQGDRDINARFRHVTTCFPCALMYIIWRVKSFDTCSLRLVVFI